MFFRCKHPFDLLAVEREQEVTPVDEDFERVTYFFVCMRCGGSLERKHARMVGGVKAFMERGAT